MKTKEMVWNSVWYGVERWGKWTWWHRIEWSLGKP
jgi:hypothetical protein